MLMAALAFHSALRTPHSALAQGPSSLTVGRVTALYWPGAERAAQSFAAAADESGPWPGISQASLRPIRLIIADNPARFDSLTGGEVPSWAEAAYALAATAIQLLARIGGERGVEPIITALGRTSDLDAALRQAHAVTLDQFEGIWQKDLTRRYGWLSFFSSLTLFWGLLAVL